MKILLLTAMMALINSSCISIKTISNDGNSPDVIVNTGDKHEKHIVASDKMETIQKDCQDFKDIDIEGSINVVYIQSDKSSYKLNGPDNVLPLVKIEEKEKTMKASLTKPVRFTEGKKVTLTLYGSGLEEIDLSGASGFKCDRMENPTGKLELDCSGASYVNLENVTVAELDFDISGASSLNGSALKADIISIDITGACGGKLEKLMAGRVEAEISGASSLILGGETEVADYEVSGASSLKAYGLKAATGKAKASGSSSIAASIQQVISKKASGYSEIKIK